MSIQTTRPTTDWDMGRAVLSAFCTADPRLTPELLSSWSTQHGVFSDIEACAPFWAMPARMDAAGKKTDFALGMGWRRSHAPQYRAEISDHTGTSKTGHLIYGTLMLHGPYNKATDWQALFVRLCAAMGAEYGNLRTHKGATQSAIWIMHPVTGMLEGMASVITLPVGRVLDHHRTAILAAGFGMTVQEAGVIIALMPTLAEARDNVPALEARYGELAAILNDGTWQPPKKPSWWDGR